MKKVLALILALVMTMSLVACGGNNAGGEEEKSETPSTSTTTPPTTQTSTGEKPADPSDENKDRIVHMAVNTEFNSLDPHNTTAAVTVEVLNNIYESLVYVDFDNEGKLIYKLAESHEVSDDGTVWTFKIRQGVKFHDGSDMTVEDVVYSIQRAMNPETSLVAKYTVGIVDVKAEGTDTVVITLDASRAAFLANLSNVRIVSKAFVEANGADMATKLNGTGPYKTVSAELASGVEVTRFDEYWGEAPAIAGATWDVIKDAATQAMALEGGDLDFIMASHALYSDFEAMDGVEVGLVPTYHTIYVAFNPNVEPFTDVRVRQAFAYLINNEETSMAMFEGYAETDGLILNHNILGLPSYEEMLQYDYEYNVEKGLALLKEAGYDLEKEPLNVGKILTYPETNYITKSCPVIQAQLAKHNIIVEIDAKETSAFAADLYAGNFSMAMAGGAWGADASMYHFLVKEGDGGNFFQWSDEKCSELFLQAELELDAEKRADLYLEALKIVMEAMPGKSVGHKYNAYAWSEDLVPALRMNQYFLSEWTWK